MAPRTLTRAGTRLALWDLGGDGPPALLVHGLAGHAGEWAETAAWLGETRHVFALDLRGHGHSEPRPADVSPAALSDDVCFALEHIGAPALLLGHSLGGRVAIPAAAARPDLVDCLVVAEAGPAGSVDGAELKAAEVEAGLKRWPVPFPDAAAAEEYFGGPGARANAWTSGLRRVPDGRLYRRFEVEVLARMIQATAAEDCWKAWSVIACPTLVVRGSGSGGCSVEEVRRMLADLPGVRCTEGGGRGTRTSPRGAGALAGSRRRVPGPPSSSLESGP
jgi:pimeloyl-ACP methyl ester carboxylesterase